MIEYRTWQQVTFRKEEMYMSWSRVRSLSQCQYTNLACTMFMFSELYMRRNSSPQILVADSALWLSWCSQSDREISHTDVLTASVSMTQRVSVDVAVLSLVFYKSSSNWLLNLPSDVMANSNVVLYTTTLFQRDVGPGHFCRDGHRVWCSIRTAVRLSPYSQSWIFCLISTCSISSKGS